MRGDELAGAGGGVAARVAGAQRVAVVAAPTLETVVTIAGALAAGCCVVPINPDAGPDERGHLLVDAKPDVLFSPGDVDVDARAGLPPPPPVGTTPALIVYTSGTTGRPKGAVIPRRAVAGCLDALAARWQLTTDDWLVHALPLFHVHGLVLGTLGPLRGGLRLTVPPALQPVRGATVY